MDCPGCGAKNRESAKFCTKCGTRLLSEPTDQPIDMGPYPSVYQQYHDLKYQESNDVLPPPLDADIWPPAVVRGQEPAATPEGTERSIAWSLILSLLTCGIYGFVWLYLIGKDLRKLTGRNDPHPGLDVFLTVLTCNIWAMVLAYNYPKLIDQCQRRADLPESHLSLVCLLLAIFSLWKVYGLGLIGLALMQNEMNKIWRKMRDAEP